MTVVERKSGYAVIAKVENKTSDLVGVAIVDRLKPTREKVKTLTFDNGKEFCDTPRLTRYWAARVTLQGPLPTVS